MQGRISLQPKARQFLLRLMVSYLVFKILLDMGTA